MPTYVLVGRLGDPAPSYLSIDNYIFLVWVGMAPGGEFSVTARGGCGSGGDGVVWTEACSGDDVIVVGLMPVVRR